MKKISLLLLVLGGCHSPDKDTDPRNPYLGVYRTVAKTSYSVSSLVTTGLYSVTVSLGVPANSLRFNDGTGSEEVELHGNQLLFSPSTVSLWTTTGQGTMTPAGFSFTKITLEMGQTVPLAKVDVTGVRD